jgi:hypothetical protein
MLIQSVATRLRSLRRFILSTLVPEVIWPEYVTMDNARIAVRHAPYSFGIKRYLSRLDYENSERALVRELIRPGDHVLEMGGSIGVLTAILAESIGSSGRIVSIEANERLANYSSTWLSRYSHATILQGFAFPVFRIKGSLRTRFHEGQGSLGGFVKFEIGGPDGEGAGEGGKTYCISDIIHLTGMSPTVLVVDIEGSEAIMLDVSPDFPESVHVIIMELHRNMYGDAVLNGIIKTIEKAGFRLVKQITDVYAFERQRSIL